MCVCVCVRVCVLLATSRMTRRRRYINVFVWMYMCSCARVAFVDYYKNDEETHVPTRVTREFFMSCHVRISRMNESCHTQMSAASTSLLATRMATRCRYVYICRCMGGCGCGGGGVCTCVCVCECRLCWLPQA